MLGDKVQELQGRITNVSVRESEDGEPLVEVSFQASGTILGQKMTEIGTYISRLQPDGNYKGEGIGVIQTAAGNVSWTGQGRGRPTGKGMGASWRGSIYFTTESAKLAKLNGMATVFEWDVDEDGQAKGTVWEWR